MNTDDWEVITHNDARNYKTDYVDNILSVCRIVPHRSAILLSAYAGHAVLQYYSPVYGVHCFFVQCDTIYKIIL